MYSEIAFFVKDICDATLESEGINKIRMHICFLKTLLQYTLKKRVLNWLQWFISEPLKSLHWPKVS